MSNCNRIHAINTILARHVPAPLDDVPAASVADYGIDVFNEESMRKYLPKETAEKLIATITKGAPLDAEIAGDVAHAMKVWAMDNGVTHYTHWFQPLTSGTAEKHDSFLEPGKHGDVLMSFSGKNLIVGEPDASSFPSGGIRSTFEARGYTAWDPTSPAFIKRHSNGATLCIPTVFCSYTGEALDKKTPLLRSIQALKTSVIRFMKCFGVDQDTFSVTLGAEQEYFLVDKAFYLHRPDLVQTGRTVFGAPPPKHQQLEDHYFGSIKPRVLAFMTEVEAELWRLGIPAKTRHNEVAPAQFELAPVFEELNLAVDHNMLVMETLRQVADRNGLVCLMHEKPFEGVNGSGKHNNWSVSYGKHRLLDPGKNPEENMIFLTTLAAIIRAVDIHADLLRATTCSCGNDHRLGANEAPPAIISIFLGDQLTDVIEQIVGGTTGARKKHGTMIIGVDTLPALPRDATDRNRTSPFAFTGNKFEFRAPGASQSCSAVNMMLNTAVAESLDYISDRLENVSEKTFAKELQALLRDIITTHKRIIFNGNGYSKAWEEEAARRGLPNLTTTPEALRPLLDERNQNLVEKYGVLSKVEMTSRYDVFLEEYHRILHIEGEIALEIARSQILPVVTETYTKYASAIAASSALSTGANGLKTTAERIGRSLDELTIECEALEEALLGEHEGIVLTMTRLRKTVDALEHLIDDSVWPLPKYREMLFLY